MKKLFFNRRNLTVLLLMVAISVSGQQSKIAKNDNSSSSIAITNVRVFNGKKLSRLKTVVIENGLISSSKTGQTTIDGNGGTLLPGLIDSHVHLRSLDELQEAAQRGVTTMLDMGAFEPELFNEARTLTGVSDIKTTLYSASAPGSHQVTRMGAPESSVVNGPEDAERFVAELITEGADYIKVIVENPNIDFSPALETGTIKAIVDAAHKNELLVFAHAAYNEAFKMATDAGVDVISHTPLDTSIDADIVSKMAKQKTILVPTLVMMQGTVEAFKDIPMFKDLDYDHAVSSVSAMQKAGITIIAGTDANNAKAAPFSAKHGEALHDELELLVAAGLTPIEALRSATILPAQHFNLQDRGEIKPGKRADLVLVDGDPTKDISKTRNIQKVWVNGVPVQNK